MEDLAIGPDGFTGITLEGGLFRIERPEILASNGRIHEEMRTVLAAARARR